MAPIAKAEPTELATLIDMMKQAISKLGMPGAPAPLAKPPASALRDHHCHFCGGDHWKSSCKVLKEYVCDGKCILHDDGHIVCLVDASFLAPSLGRPLENISTNGTDRIQSPP